MVHLLAGWPSPHCSCYVQKKACESQLLEAGQLVEKKEKKERHRKLRNNRARSRNILKWVVLSFSDALRH